MKTTLLAGELIALHLDYDVKKQQIFKPDFGSAFSGTTKQVSNFRINEGIND